MLNTLRTININCLLPCLLILIMGISSGIFSGGIIPSSEKLYLISLLDSSTAQWFPVILINMTSLALILFAGFTIYGFPLALLILFSRCFAVGFCDCLLLYNIDSESASGFILSFLLPQLLICTAHLLAATVATGYAMHHLQNKTHR